MSPTGFLDARLCLRIGESRSLRLAPSLPLASIARSSSPWRSPPSAPPPDRLRPNAPETRGNETRCWPWLPLPTSPESTPKATSRRPLATSSSPRFPRFYRKSCWSAYLYSVLRSPGPAGQDPCPPTVPGDRSHRRPFSPCWHGSIGQAIEYWESFLGRFPKQKICLFGSLLGIIGILLAAILSPFQPRPAALPSGRLCRRPASRVAGPCARPPYANLPCAPARPGAAEPVLLLPVAHL